MPTDLLSTTEAGKILGCSRQHVAKLCDSGKLPCTRVGKHRRIRREDVEQQQHPLRREDERSLWLNYAFAAKLTQDPDGVIERAKERLQDLRRAHRHGRSDTYLDQWEAILGEGAHAVLAVMTERSDRGQVLRSTSPLSGLGLLTEQERGQILAAFRAWWNRTQRGRS